MATIENVLGLWRQVKRLLSLVVLGGGVFLLWQVYTGDLQGPVLAMLGAILTIIGLVGVVSPSSVRTFHSTSGPD